MSHLPMEKTYVFLPVEIKARELHGKLLLALAAAEAGFKVVLGGQRELRQRLHMFPPGIYIDKSVASSKDRWFTRFRRLGNRIVAWDEEGLVIHEKQYLKSRFSKHAFDQVDLFFAWGSAQRDILIREVPDKKDIIMLAGNSRFDLLRPELKAFYSSAASRLNKEHGKIILINTNFGFYNHLRGLVEAKKGFMKSSSHASEKFIDDWITFQKQLFDYFVESIPWLSTNFPDHTIIVRPHPSENDTRWHQLLEKFPNVKVDKKGNVLEWIVASDVVIHSNCTTGIEAYLLGVPVIAYRPELSEMYETYLPNSVSKNIFTFGELQDVMNDIIVDGESNKYVDDEDVKKVASQYISNIEGVLATDFIIHELKELDDKKSNQRLSDVLLRMFQLSTEKIRVAKDSVQSILPAYKKAATYDQQKFPGITIDEIESLMAVFQNVTKRFLNTTVSRSGESCFLIERVE